MEVDICGVAVLSERDAPNSRIRGQTPINMGKVKERQFYGRTVEYFAVMTFAISARIALLTYGSNKKRGTNFKDIGNMQEMLYSHRVQV